MMYGSVPLSFVGTLADLISVLMMLNLLLLLLFVSAGSDLCPRQGPLAASWRPGGAARLAPPAAQTFQPQQEKKNV